MRGLSEFRVILYRGTPPPHTGSTYIPDGVDPHSLMIYVNISGEYLHVYTPGVHALYIIHRVAPGVSCGEP